MELQPPWASELLARNRKVARNICWSTRSSASSPSTTLSTTSSRSNGICRQDSDELDGARTNEKSNLEAGEAANYHPLDIMKTNGSSSMMKNSGEESFLEYGPGIVWKLRSRFQSLALRQSSGRPTLRRSASLENCLDSASSDPISSESPSPVPLYEDEVDGHYKSGNSNNNKRRNPVPFRTYSGQNNNNGNNNNNTSSNTVLIYNNHVNNQGSNNTVRGRSGYGDARSEKNGSSIVNSRNHDRMRRARSVDALHRPSKRHVEEKEILEKLTVVLPKEEVVIIEVSKPHHVANLSNGFDLDKQYPRSLHLHSNSCSSGNALSGYSSPTGNHNSESNRGVRSVTSPVHELPPPDIVRETARIFEKNDQIQNHHGGAGSGASPNGGSSAIHSGANNFVSSAKKVGHALRLSKSSSVSPTTSPLPSPTMAQNNISSSIMTTAMMNGQSGIPYHIPHNKTHLNNDQGLNTSNGVLNHHSNATTTTNRGAKAQDPRNFTTASVHGNNSAFHSKPAPTTNSSSSSSNSYASGNIHQSSNKQIGVIRPTVTTTTGGVISNNQNQSLSGSSSKKINPGSVGAVKESAINGSSTLPSPDVSPIPNITTKKPPLGPKPLITSSPKNLTFQANKTVGSVSSSAVATSPTNATFSTKTKSPEPESMSEPRMKSPTGNTTLLSSNRGVSTKFSKSIEIPLEKEELAEFKQITLKPVAKAEENHSQVIVTNGTKINLNKTKNSTNNNIPNKTGDSSSIQKTEKKDEKTNANSNNVSNTTSSKSNTRRIAPSAPAVAPATTAATSTPLVSSNNTNSAKEASSKVPHLSSSSKKETENKPRLTDHPKEPPQQQSLLRTHQQQKLDKQKKSSGGETMVFNFTNRKSVPDYIEDDGLHRVKLTLGGTVTDESQDDDGSELNSYETVDARLITFEGANVIINGRSSIQKKPKSQKLNISFNDEAPVTFEYPSEASIIGEDEADTKDSGTSSSLLGNKAPNITNGSGLGSYTPSKLGNSYQLGNYSSDRVVVTRKPAAGDKKEQENGGELIEDYLKPDTASTAWSKETGAADILF